MQSSHNTKNMTNREKVNDIRFITSPPLIDKDLELYLIETVKADHQLGYLPFYRFNMIHSESKLAMGGINLRIGYTHNVKFFRGNVGFTVFESFRGNNYAARSCKLLFPIATHHKLSPLWLTCNVENEASKKTIESIGAKYIETITMPDDYPYVEHYPPGARTKLRFQLNIL